MKKNKKKVNKKKKISKITSKIKKKVKKKRKNLRIRRKKNTSKKLVLKKKTKDNLITKSVRVEENIKSKLNIKDVSMASADEVKKITGYTIGGVSPIGHLSQIAVLIDNSFERFNDLFAAAGHPNCVFKISLKDLKNITNGEIHEITE